MNESDYLDVLEDAAERGTLRGAEAVYRSAAASAAASPGTIGPGGARRPAGARRAIVVAAVVIVLVGAGVAVTRRGEPLQVTTEPTATTIREDVASGDVSCSVLGFWEVLDSERAARSVVVGRLGAPGPWTAIGPPGFDRTRRTWAFEEWATVGVPVQPTPITSVVQTGAPACGPEVELHDGDVVVSATSPVTKPGELPAMASAPTSVFFVVRADGAPPPDRAALTDPAVRVRSHDGASVCRGEPCTWSELVTEIGDPALRPGPRIIGTLRMTGGPYPGLDQGIPGTVEVRNQAREVVQTVATDADGRFEVRVRNGRYEVSGTSPNNNDGQSRCVVPEPVDVLAGRDTIVDVRCQIR